MNIQSDAIPGSSLESHVVAPAVIPASRRIYWSVRRELWEYRSIYVAPLAAAALFLAGFLIHLIRFPGEMRFALGLSLSPMEQQMWIGQPYDFAALLLIGVSLLVAVFYCLDALDGERRDRSILFWKSLPVSDLMTVLSKASIPVAVIPLLTFAITIVTQWVMLLLSSAVLLGSGLSAGTLWDHLPLFPMSVMLLFHLVAGHGLWYAPIFGWLLMVSAWARRMPFLWATVPLLAIGVVEKIAFNTSHFVEMLRNRFPGVDEGAGFTNGSMSMDPLSQLNVGHFLSSPGLWIGLAVFAVFLAVAVRLRRYQGPI
jgi:ABC-2 type transport system permease protein